MNGKLSLSYLAFAAVVLLDVFVAAAALIGAAGLTALPMVFLSAGWLAFAVGVHIAAGICLPRRIRWSYAAVTLAALSIIGSIALSWPASGTEPPPPPETAWVRLPTGSRIAYLKLAATGQPRGVPVIFLHGGPAVADMGGDAVYLKRLTADGYDVYLYDQLGAGHSSRLADPTQYTVARAVADLDAFRRAIGADRVDLLGYSWGGTLAAAYLAAHASHVAKVVFISPGRMVGGRGNLMDLFRRLDPTQILSVLGQALEPRAFLAWTLMQFNPRAAHAFAGDAEMDARFRAIVAATAPALYCHPPARTTGGDPGFFANAMLLRPTAWGHIDPHVALRQVDTPALIVKGQCDYLSWSSATDYRDTLPHACLIYIPGAGHRIYAERPTIFFAAVEAFLDGKSLPLPIVTVPNPPPGYEGPVTLCEGGSVNLAKYGERLRTMQFKKETQNPCRVHPSAPLQS